jgi:hypothetical protein
MPEDAWNKILNKCKYKCEFKQIINVTIDKNKEIRINKYCQHCSAIHVWIIKNTEIEQKKEVPVKEPPVYNKFHGGNFEKHVNQDQEKQPSSLDCSQKNLF